MMGRLLTYLPPLRTTVSMQEKLNGDKRQQATPPTSLVSLALTSLNHFCVVEYRKDLVLSPIASRQRVVVE